MERNQLPQRKVRVYIGLQPEWHVKVANLEVAAAAPEASQIKVEVVQFKDECIIIIHREQTRVLIVAAHDIWLHKERSDVAFVIGEHFVNIKSDCVDERGFTALAGCFNS